MWQTLLILSLTIVKYMNCEHTHCLNQQFECKKWKSTSRHNSNAPVICEETESVILDGSFLLHLILWGETTRCQDTGMKYTISSFLSASVFFNRYSEALTTNDDTDKCSLEKRSFSKNFLPLRNFFLQRNFSLLKEFFLQRNFFSLRNFFFP